METGDDETLSQNEASRFIHRIMVNYRNIIGCFSSNGGDTDLGPPGTNLR